MGLSLKAQVASLPPQGTRAGQCQTPSIYLAAKLSERLTSPGERAITAGQWAWREERGRERSETKML